MSPKPNRHVPTASSWGTSTRAIAVIAVMVAMAVASVALTQGRARAASPSSTAGARSATRALATATITVRLTVPAVIQVHAPPVVQLLDGCGEFDASLLSNADWQLTMCVGEPVQWSLDGGSTWISATAFTNAVVLQGKGSNPSIHVKLRASAGGSRPLTIGLSGTVSAQG